jgi:Tol biopolymer transport system component
VGHHPAEARYHWPNSRVPPRREGKEGEGDTAHGGLQRTGRDGDAAGGGNTAASLPAYGKGKDGPSAETFPGGPGAIAFSSSDITGLLDIYRMDIDGFGATNLTDGAAGDHSQPAWSAEGTRIAFVSSRDSGDSEIYVMTATGRRQTRLTINPGLDTEPSWFPSDARIAFRRGSGTSPQNQADIYALALDADARPDGNPIQLTTSEFNDIMPAVSPDGKRIAFASDRDGDYEIYVMKAAPEGPKNKPVRLRTTPPST